MFNDTHMAIREWALTVLAWMVAVAAPTSFFSEHRIDPMALGLFLMLLSVSYWFGLSARRRGKRVAYHLQATAPLVLATVSIIIGLLIFRT